VIDRDKQIIRTLEKFRVMRRDDIIELFFCTVKGSISQCNRTLKRLRRDKYITYSSEHHHQYIYFPIPSIKKDSAKIPHFLSIVDVYKQMYKHEIPRTFDVEPKLGGKGTIEPDVFAIWKKTPIFVEIQRNIYSKATMKRKMNLYKSYFYGETWKELSWQPEKKKLFPIILMLTEHQYELEVPFKVFQVNDVNEFVELIKPKG
jgi:hypothetical protein